MTKNGLSRFGFALTFLALSLLTVGLYNFVSTKGTVESAPSYQEKNLEVLKSVKPNDLVLCIVGVDTPSAKINRAILVEQNDGTRLLGYAINQHSAEYITGGGYSYEFFSICEARIVKEPFAMETIGRIILHGLNPPPAK